MCLPYKGGISVWVPGVVYRIPWRKFGWRLPNVEQFHAARTIIVAKHHLPL